MANELESRTRSIRNSLVSGTLKIGSPNDLKIIARLFVKIGRFASAAASKPSSDVWQYFGPLYSKYYVVSSKLKAQTIPLVFT